MKKHLLKSLFLSALFVLGVTSAGADDKTVVKYSFDDATSPAVTAGSRMSLDYTKTSVITNTKFLNAWNNTNGDPGASTISLGSTDLSEETWTLSFEWAAVGGCNSKPDHTTLKAGETTLFDLSGNSNWNTTVTLNVGGATLPVPGCDKGKRFTAATGDQMNTTAYWHHFVITGSSDGVKLTITNSNSGTTIVENVVLSTTNVNPTSLIIEPCCGGAIGIDELSLSYNVAGEVIQTPAAAYTAVNGINRTITATCDTEGATLYYSTDGENWTEGAQVDVNASGNIYFKAVKGTSESDVLTFAAEAGTTIVLNTPTIARNENGTVTISADQSKLLLSPTATIYYTYGEENGSFTGTKQLTVAADATITAYAEADGYTTSENATRAVALFPEQLNAIFSAPASTSGWSANAFSATTITASERTYATLLLDDAAWNENVLLQTDGAWGLRASGNWYINSNTANSWLLVKDAKAGNIVVVDATFAPAETVNATYTEKYSFGTKHAYIINADGNAEFALIKPTASEMDYLYGVYGYSLMNETLVVAKEALQTTIAIATNINPEGLADAIAAAQAALTAEGATAESMAQAAQTLEAAIKTYFGEVLPNLGAIVTALNEETLNTAYADAQAALAKEDVTPQELVTAMQGIITAAQAVAPAHLQNLKGYAVKYGATDAATLVDNALAAIEAGNVSQIIATMTAVKEAATPLATSILTQMIADAQSHELDVTEAQAALEGGNYITMIITAKALYAKMTDYTSYIVNADLTGEGGFDATGTKGISGGIVKVGNAAAFDFNQTIANLPAGKYKVTAQAAYRYGADEAAEAAAIAAETDTKLVQLYATVGEKTVSAKVQNRYDGASETDYANGNGSVTVNEKFVPNSSDAVKAWFDAGKYVNEVIFNLPADGAVTIGINRTGTPESDYTVIGPWTLTRLGDAEAEPEPEVPALANADFEGEYTVFASPKDDRDIYQPAGWTITYENGEENDMSSLNSECKQWSQFSGRPQLGEAGGNNTYWVRFRWGASETLTLSQKVTLATGDYKLSADAFFNGADGASATISAAGQSTAITGNSTWANHSVIFSLAEETEVTIALNVTQTQQVENVAAFDNVKLEVIDATAEAKADLEAAITAAKAIETEGKAGVEELNAAIADAETALNAADATIESLNAAKTALAAAIAEFEDANITVPALAGWTRVRTANIENVADNYYVLVDANSRNYVMSNEADHYRPCYKTVAEPVANPSFVWSLEGSDNTFALKSFSTGTYFIAPANGWDTSMTGSTGSATFQFTLNNGVYSVKCVQSNALVGHWNDSGAAVAEDGENIAANKQAKDAPGFYLFAISKTAYNNAILAARAEATAGASKENGIDVTAWIQNADWSGDFGGWARSGSWGNMQWGQKTLEVWNASNVVVKQTLTAVPDGTYKLTADVISGNGDNKVAVVYGTGGATVKSDAVSAEASAGNYTTMSNEVAGNTLIADNIVVTGGVLTVGLDIAAGWIVADNFKLYYYGEDMSQYVDAYHTALAAAQAIDQNAPMNGEVLVILNRDLAAYASIDETNKETLLAATSALSSATEAANASIAAYATAANVLPKMKQLTEETNVYTAEALASYYTQWADKYEARTLTNNEANALQDPYAQTSWQHDANMKVDDLLLSAWSFGEVKAKDYETALYINTWSVEGNNDGSEFRVPFFEYWTGDGESLGETVLTATMNNLKAGEYDVTAWVRVCAKNGYEAPAYGINLQANSGVAVDVAAGDQVGESQFFLKEFTASGTVAADGVLNIKFNIAADNNISWLSFKNVKYTWVKATDITTLKQNITEGTIYNLNGQKVEKARKGLYIINGKKVVIK